ncbi:hypothetical protein HanIR_Chr16g0803271 [Helianthus annuus]|nr:hypothetical protein HanIR_Chr16g0803271 [Helianthus annuus]
MSDVFFHVEKIFFCHCLYMTHNIHIIQIWKYLYMIDYGPMTIVISTVAIYKRHFNKIYTNISD